MNILTQDDFKRIFIEIQKRYPDNHNSISHEMNGFIEGVIYTTIYERTTTTTTINPIASNTSNTIINTTNEEKLKGLLAINKELLDFVKEIATLNLFDFTESNCNLRIKQRAKTLFYKATLSK